jgi:hypothetical protein
MIVRFERSDPAAAYAGFGQSRDPFDVWSRQRMMEISGVDLSVVPDGPPPELILDWTI